MLARAMTYRLTDEPGGLGLSCNGAGLMLAGVPLLRKSETGFVPRPAHAIAALIDAAYDGDERPGRLQSSLTLIADALNRGDLARATMAAVLSETPEISPQAAIRLAKTDRELAKYNFNPAEPRGARARWTRDGDDSTEIELRDLESAKQRTDPVGLLRAEVQAIL